MLTNKNNNPVLISDTIADILYNKIQTQYKKFGNPVIHITDFEVFQAALASRNPSNIWFYNPELVAKSLNKIKGVSVTYFCYDQLLLDAAEVQLLLGNLGAADSLINKISDYNIIGTFNVLKEKEDY